jgi:ParB family chromosome partitioning protein
MSSYGPGIITRTNSYHIDPTTIDRRVGWNPRFDFGEIEELAQSIKQNGLLQPLRVKRVGDRFELIDGDRRLTAVEHLMKKGLEFPQGVLAIIESKSATDLDNMILMFESNSGKPFLPLEAAKAYKMLMDAEGLTCKQVAHRLGRSEAHVKFTVALMDADIEVTDALEKGEINSVVARTIAKTKDKAKQRELVSKVKSAGKGRKEQQAVRKEVEAGVRKRTPIKNEPALKSAQDALKFLESIERLLAEHIKQLGFTNMEQLSAAAKESDLNTALHEYGMVRAVKHLLGQE